jgi:hypothetical protein
VNWPPGGEGSRLAAEGDDSHDEHGKDLLWLMRPVRDCMDSWCDAAIAPQTRERTSRAGAGGTWLGQRQEGTGGAVQKKSLATKGEVGQSSGRGLVCDGG